MQCIGRCALSTTVLVPNSAVICNLGHCGYNCPWPCPDQSVQLPAAALQAKQDYAYTQLTCALESKLISTAFAKSFYWEKKQKRQIEIRQYGLLS